MSAEPMKINGLTADESIKRALAENPDGASRTVQALRKRRDASKERKDARYSASEAEQLECARRLDAEAVALMKPVATPIIRGGEVARLPGHEDDGPVWELQNTLHNPDQTAIDASVVRSGLLLEVGKDVVPLALDAAGSIQADNSLEKMLAHQLAALHVLTLKSAKRALEFEGDRAKGPWQPPGFSHTASVEMGRQSNAVARLAQAFQEGCLTLQRLKQGSKQTVVVRYETTVQPGGQAVIGNVSHGGEGRQSAPPVSCGLSEQEPRE